MTDEWMDQRADEGRQALDDGRLDDAEAILVELTSAGSTRPDVWWNLGLMHKLRKHWPASLAAFRRNAELAPAPEAYWNIGIAATALRDWATARWAWARLGLDPGPGEGAPAGDFGVGPVRLNPDGNGEVVWGRRVDPCRMRIESVPLPESGHRWHDVVLHDVVPNGSRTFRGQELPVFDALERMDPSPFPTLHAELHWADAGDEQELHDRLAAEGLGGEHWSASVRMLCARCSVAERHVHDDLAAALRLSGTWGFGGPRALVEATLRAWQSARRGRDASALETGLDASPAAGLDPRPDADPV